MTNELDHITDKHLEAQLNRDQGGALLLFTVGYGGRKPEELTALLCSRGVKTVVDTRLRPDRAAMGVYVKAKSADKGIEKLLREAGVGYASLVELGNLFVDLDDWEPRYRRLLAAAGDLLVERLLALATPICLLCCEKDPAQCHRRLIADFLAHRGWSMEHIL
jgi:uncharacterized protein (DUF488 family)